MRLDFSLTTLAPTSLHHPLAASDLLVVDSQHQKDMGLVRQSISPAQSPVYKIEARRRPVTIGAVSKSDRPPDQPNTIIVNLDQQKHPYSAMPKP